jgi:hypothetical protein
MRLPFSLLLVLAFLLDAGAQCESNQIQFFDADWNQIDSNLMDHIYVLNKGADTLKLEPLYSEGLTDLYPFGNYINSAILTESFAIEKEETKFDSLEYCIYCAKKDIVLVDSIDLNKDGVKELFILRDWNCSASPPVRTRFGIGVQDQHYAQFEVWDVVSKKKIFEVKHIFHSNVAVSTNVIRDYGYIFEAVLDEKGSFLLSNPSGMEIPLEMGKYRYSKRQEKYQLD